MKHIRKKKKKQIADRSPRFVFERKFSMKKEGVIHLSFSQPVWSQDHTMLLRLIVRNGYALPF